MKFCTTWKIEPVLCLHTNVNNTMYSLLIAPTLILSDIAGVTVFVEGKFGSFKLKIFHQNWMLPFNSVFILDMHNILWFVLTSVSWASTVLNSCDDAIWLYNLWKIKLWCWGHKNKGQVIFNKISQHIPILPFSFSFQIQQPDNFKYLFLMLKMDFTPKEHLKPSSAVKSCFHTMTIEYRQVLRPNLPCRPTCRNYTCPTWLRLTNIPPNLSYSCT